MRIVPFTTRQISPLSVLVIDNIILTAAPWWLADGGSQVLKRPVDFNYILSGQDLPSMIFAPSPDKDILNKLIRLSLVPAQPGRPWNKHTQVLLKRLVLLLASGLALWIKLEAAANLLPVKRWPSENKERAITACATAPFQLWRLNNC